MQLRGPVLVSDEQEKITLEVRKLLSKAASAPTYKSPDELHCAVLQRERQSGVIPFQELVDSIGFQVEELQQHVTLAHGPRKTIGRHVRPALMKQLDHVSGVCIRQRMGSVGVATGFRVFEQSRDEFEAP